MESTKPSYSDLIGKMESLKGFKIIQEIESLKATNYIFRKNFNDLIDKIKEYESDNEIWYVKNRPLLHQMHLEILRLLHNYASSILSLIDHTRNFRKKIKEKKLESVFDFEINKLAINDVVTFMKQLRQYFQHYRLPITKAQFSVEKLNGSEDRYSKELKMQLDVEELLKWKGWNGISKRYLKNFNENVEIEIFCQEYYGIIEQFYEIFYDIVLKAYNPEINELLMFQEGINKLYQPASKID